MATDKETPKTDLVLWRYLSERREAVLVGTDDFDMLIEPVRRVGSLGCATSFAIGSRSRSPTATRTLFQLPIYLRSAWTLGGMP